MILYLHRLHCCLSAEEKPCQIHIDSCLPLIQRIIFKIVGVSGMSSIKLRIHGGTANQRIQTSGFFHSKICHCLSRSRVCHIQFERIALSAICTGSFRSFFSKFHVQISNDHIRTRLRQGLRKLTAKKSRSGDNCRLSVHPKFIKNIFVHRFLVHFSLLFIIQLYIIIHGLSFFQDFQPLQTSIQLRAFEYFSSSGRVSSIALLPEPAAG